MKKLFALLCALGILFSLTACNTAADAEYTVGICQYVNHRSLNASTQGFKDALTEALGDSVSFVEQNAAGEYSNCTAIANDLVAQDVDLILANSTLALQTCTSATGDIPILGTSDTIELTGEMIDDMPDFLKGLFKLTGIGIASSTILLVVGILLLVFGLPLLLLFLLLYLLFRRGKSDTSAPQATDTPAPDRALFNKGVKNTCLGVGLAICLGIWMGDIGVGIGILVACIGIGELLIDHFSRK